LLSKDRLG